MSAELEGKPARHRVAIFHLGANGEDRMGQATFCEGEDGKWIVKLDADTEISRRKVHELFENFKARYQSAEMKYDTASDGYIEFLIASIQQDGYQARKIPAGDFNFSLQMNFASGVMMATNTPLHGGVAEDGALGRRIFNAMSSAIAKPSEELAIKIEDLCAMAKFEEAATALREADTSLIAFARSRRLLMALGRLEMTRLTTSDRAHVLDVRILLAEQLGDFVSAGNDASVLLAEAEDGIGHEKVCALKMLVAVGAIKRGNKEAGLSLLREIAAASGALSAEGRAWAWRNMALTLDRDDPEACRAFKLSADAFLEAGNKNEAGKSLMHLANLLLDVNPNEAMARLNEVINVLGNEGVIDDYVRASAFHARASRLSRLGQHEAAYEDAIKAVELKRGLIGDDEGLVSSLNLAAIEARYIGKKDSAEALSIEADRLTSDLQLPHFLLAARVKKLADEYDQIEAEAIISEAESIGDLEIVAAVRTLRAITDEGMNDIQRLEELEELTRQVTNSSGERGMLKPARAAIYQLLAKKRQFKRAERWCRAAINEDAFDGDAQQYLVHCLWEQEKWGDAAEFLRRQIALKGELPDLNYALGKSEFNAGALSNAVTTLTKLINTPDVKKGILQRAAELRERALQLGGVPLPPAQVATTGSVAREEFEEALDNFASFIASDKRMRFWVRQTDGKHKWVANPERLAQDLLHTFLKARFSQRIEVLEEVASGAGRLDLYVRLEGGLSIILELKMCGSGYSSRYASSGEEQIIHYMDNRRVYLGYLVVFDARVDLFSNELIKGRSGAYTVIEKFIDVRSSTKNF